MTVSIIIPVYNEAFYLAHCLEAIAAQTVPVFEVLVMDNNSTDDTALVAAGFPFARVIPVSQQGTVFARNAGFQTAKGDILARLDADSIPPTDWIAKLQDSFQQSTTSAVTGPPRFYDIVLPKFADKAQVLIYQRLQKLLTGSYLLWGANMALRRSVWHKIAADCSLRTDIDEDIDLSFCLRTGGYDISYLPHVTMPASFQRGRVGPLYTARYVSNWPRDYWLHAMYVRGIFIAALCAVGVLLSVPLGLLQRLKFIGG